MPTYTITGTATVTVYVVVEADTDEEALEKAKAAEQHEWECDNVDGEVAIDEESVHQVG